jgi:hypothetical protein
MKWNPDVDWLIQLIFIGLGAIAVAFLIMVAKFWFVW